jgi:DME family drug/metabolite transporter/O-acetylserine/cysteine efflux transporter
MSLKDSILALVMVVVWGVNFVAIAFGLEDFPPLLMGGLRFLLVAIVGCWFVSRSNVPIKWLLAYALSISVAQFAFLFVAMAVGMPAGLASLLLQSQALFTLVFAYIVLKEAISSRQIMAIAVAGFGLCLIALNSQHTQMTTLGFFMTLAAATCWAIGNLVTRTISQQGFKADVSLVVWSAFVSAATLLILSLFLEGYQTIQSAILSISWLPGLSLLYLALVATLLGYGIWSYLIGKYPAGLVVPWALGVPVIGLVAASIVLDEELRSIQLLGISLVMIALVINLPIDKFIKSRWRQLRSPHRAKQH